MQIANKKAIQKQNGSSCQSPGNLENVTKSIVVVEMRN